MAETRATHEFQFSSADHQEEVSVAGIWLFLATEVLFFGALFLAWIFARYFNEAGFNAAALETSLVIGTINTITLLASSVAFALGVVFIRAGNTHRLIQCCIVVMALGALFMVLKFAVEWRDDFARNLFPGPDFAVQGPLRGGAQLFFTFYFFATGVHGLHMLAGLAVVAWMVRRAYRGDFSERYHTPIVVVGLYWSFVDIVWLILFPLIYLIGGAR
jgi:cytochrome c oxidase subunit 3